MHASHRRLRNLAFATMFLAWGVMRIVSVETPEDRWTVGQLVPAVLHFLVAGLFLFRSPARREGSLFDIAAALPSFVAGGAMMALSPVPSEWPIATGAVFLAGAAGAIVSLSFLGNSFAIFPALRAVVSHGPYQVVRHPAYLFETVMLAGLAIAGDWRVWLLMLLAIVFFVMRIVVEERFLSLSPSYRLYKESVRYRLVPFVW